MNDSQRRHLVVSIRHIGHLLDEAERMIDGSRAASPFASFASDFSPARRAAIRSEIDQVREQLVGFATRFGLEISGRPLDVRHALHAQLTVVGISVVEMRARYLRAYGELDSQSARQVEAACESLEVALTRLERTVESAP